MRFLSLALLCAMVPSLTQNLDEAYYERYRRQSQKVLNEVKDQLVAVSSDDDVEVEKEIDYRVIRRGVVNAWAYRDRSTGKKVIEEGLGLVTVIDWVATDVALAVMPPKTRDCGVEYIQYLGDALVEARQRNRDGFESQEVLNPFQYYSSHKQGCPHITPAEADANASVNEIRLIGIQEMTKFVLAHEIGHHIHRDYSNVSDCEQQKREVKADEYALSLVIKPGGLAPGALPLMAIFANLEGFSGDDSHSDHPAALKRIIMMISYTRNEYETNHLLRESLGSNAAEFFRSLDMMESGAREGLDAAKASGSVSACS